MADKTQDSGPATMVRSTAILGMVVALLAGLFIGAIVTKYLGPSPMAAPTAGVQTPPPGMGQQQSPAVDPQMLSEIDRLSALVVENPTDVQAWTTLGHLYFDTNQPQKAIQAYERSLELRPGVADVWVDLGVMYRRVGQPQKAIECFETALSINPEHEVAYYNKGIVQMHDLNDKAAALATWEELLAINPDAGTPMGQPLRDLVQSLRAQ